MKEKLSRNLWRHELLCKCGECGFDTADIKLIEALQAAVDHFEGVYSEPCYIIITSPNRCREHNETVQYQYNSNYVAYTSKSQHMFGRAADFKIFIKSNNHQIDPRAVATYLESQFIGKYGIGRYHNRTHFDTRSDGPARWDYS